MSSITGEEKRVIENPNVSLVPPYLISKKCTVIKGQFIFRPLTEEKTEISDYEWKMYEVWIKQVLEIPKKKIANLNKNKTINPRLCVFLVLFREGFPINKISPDYFAPKKLWEKRNRVAWTTATYFEIPKFPIFQHGGIQQNVVKGYSWSWWADLNYARVDNILGLRMDQFVHINQTVYNGPDLLLREKKSKTKQILRSMKLSVIENNDANGILAPSTKSQSSDSGSSISNSSNKSSKKSANKKSTSSGNLSLGAVGADSKELVIFAGTQRLVGRMTSPEFLQSTIDQTRSISLDQFLDCYSNFCTAREIVVFNPLLLSSIIKVTNENTHLDNEQIGKALGVAFASVNSLILPLMCVKIEIDTTQSVELLFRGSSIFMAALTQFLFCACKNYIKSCIKPAIAELLSSGADALDGDKLLFKYIFKSTNKLPREIIQLLDYMRKLTSLKFSNVGPLAMLAMFFLRFINPIITLPAKYELLKASEITTAQSKLLTNTAKSMQSHINEILNATNNIQNDKKENNSKLKNQLLKFAQKIQERQERTFGTAEATVACEIRPEILLEAEKLILQLLWKYRNQIHENIQSVMDNNQKDQLMDVNTAIEIACKIRGTVAHFLEMEDMKNSFMEWDWIMVNERRKNDGK